MAAVTVDYELDGETYRMRVERDDAGIIETIETAVALAGSGRVVWLGP